MTSTELSDIFIYVHECPELTTKNANSAYFRPQTIRVCGHGHTRTVSEGKIHGPNHRGDDGPVFKTNRGDTDCLKNVIAVASIFVDHCISSFDIPRTVLNENGPQFLLKFFQAVCTKISTTPPTTAKYHPRTNGQVEQYNSTIVS